MSGLDQPIVIANSCYHVGHERSWRVAEEQGYPEQEGLDRYVYERGGLITGKQEFEGLGQIMWERGVDIATAVDVRAAIVQRSHGADAYIVGGWRVQLAPKLIGAKGMSRPEDLRGARSVVREKWDLRYISICGALRKFKIDPEREIDWIEVPTTGYTSDESVGDLLRTGQVTMLPIDGTEADRLMAEGYPLILDLEAYYKGMGAWPPGKVIVATRQTIDHRADDLHAFLRASVRGFWFASDPRNHAYMYDLETRLRGATFNADERRLRLRKSEKSLEAKNASTVIGEHFVLDGLVRRNALSRLIEDMVESGELDGPIEVDDVLMDAASIDAFENLLGRGLIDADVLARWRRANGEPAAATR